MGQSDVMMIYNVKNLLKQAIYLLDDATDWNLVYIRVTLKSCFELLEKYSNYAERQRTNDNY